MTEWTRLVRRACCDQRGACLSQEFMLILGSARRTRETEPWPPGKAHEVAREREGRRR